ncbi:hypothetical protein K3495_g3472 [Podosphaera aphanis]|nr:hypothetical protein K3495_g3472 [Podosphaera aphanis]
MSTADIISSLGGGPTLSRSTYRRWSNMFETVLTGLGGERYIQKKLSDLNASTSSSKDTEVQQNYIRDAKIRAAILQLVPEDAYYLIESATTAIAMWEILRDHYQPNNESKVDSLLRDFWGFSIDEDTDVDLVAYKLTELQSRIASLDPDQRPSQTAKKNRLLTHSDECCNGKYSGTVIVLRLDSLLSFEAAVNAL